MLVLAGRGLLGEVEGAVDGGLAVEEVVAAENVLDAGSDLN